MPAVVGIAWATYAVVAAGLFVFSAGFTRHYQNKHESEWFATAVTIIALGLVFCTLALLPIDIFLVSSTVDSHTGLKKEWASPDIMRTITFTVQLVYYIFYGLIALFSFLLIPFAYFYFEEYDDEQPLRERITGALKYTSFFIIISTLLFLCGLFLKPSQTTPHLDLDWFKKLLIESNGEKAIAFMIACLILLGMLVFIGYTAPGLSILPLNMIKGRRHLEAESEDVENRLVAVQHQQHVLQTKYGRPNRRITAKEQRELEMLEDEERILTRRLRGINQDKASIWRQILKVIRPFEFLLGFALLGLTWVVVISIFLTIVDKVSNSICGGECGFIISHPKLFNPINFIFVNLSKVFPLDYIFMVLLILYFFLATMSGVICIGVRVLWVTLYRIGKGSTAPQGLLCSTVLLMLSLLALNYTLTTTVAPGYAHFGSQVYCNHTIGDRRDCSSDADQILPCDIDGPTDICTPTVSSTLIDRITVNTPFFGMVYYYAQWAFLGVFALGFVIAVFRRPRNNVEAESEDLIDAEEERGLLTGSRPRQLYDSNHNNNNSSY